MLHGIPEASIHAVSGIFPLFMRSGSVKKVVDIVKIFYNIGKNMIKHCNTVYHTTLQVGPPRRKTAPERREK